MKRIKHNDLTHYFLREHSTLPPAYLASCQKFFKSLKRQAPSTKPQASSLTIAVGYSRIYLERNNMDNEINDRSVNPLIRIANALEEILRLVKQDMEKYEKKKH